MSRRIGKEIARLYQCILSMSAIYFCQIRKTFAEGDGPRKAFHIWCSPVEVKFFKRPAHYNAHCNANCDANVNDRSAYHPVALFSRFISSIPVSPCHAEPQPYYDYQMEFFSRRIKKEQLLDSAARGQAAKPTTPQPKRRTEWLMKAGLERPRKTLNLARDAIEAVLHPSPHPAAAL